MPSVNATIVVHVPIEELSKELQDYEFRTGRGWSEANTLEYETPNRTYGEETCINVSDKHLFFATLSFYEKQGAKIITLHEYFATLGLKVVSSYVYPEERIKREYEESKQLSRRIKIRK
jgi:hypothetical protein